MRIRTLFILATIAIPALTAAGLLAGPTPDAPGEESLEEFRNRLDAYYAELQEAVLLGIEPARADGGPGSFAVLDGSLEVFAEARRRLPDIPDEELRRFKEKTEEVPAYFEFARVIRFIQRPDLYPMAPMKSSCSNPEQPWCNCAGEIPAIAINICQQALNVASFAAEVFNEPISKITKTIIGGACFALRCSQAVYANCVDEEFRVATMKALTCIDTPTGLRGAGCDGQDNDCDDSPHRTYDEEGEDRFPPDVSIDAGVSLRCYASTAEAQTAVLDASQALDDCGSNPSVFSDGIRRVAGTCNFDARVRATDAAGNLSRSSVQVRVDGTAPRLDTQSALDGTCHQSIGDAEQAALTAAQARSGDNCTDEPLVWDVASSQIEGDPCGLSVRLGAEDACGNRSEKVQRLLVDNDDPQVEIGNLPACFETEEEAKVALVNGARANAWDNCTWTLPEQSAVGAVPDPNQSRKLDLAFTTGYLPPPPGQAKACDLQGTVTARDLCGNEAGDSIIVTIDADPPEMSFDPAVNDQCYADIDLAEAAVNAALNITDDCMTPDEIAAMKQAAKTHSTVTECSLRVQITAEDDCGNESSAATTVRVDTAVPIVEIQRKLVAPRDEACYESVEDAEDSIFGFTHFRDNCTHTGDLDRGVASVPDPVSGACDLTVTSSATDECGNTNSDSVLVRADGEAPEVRCHSALQQLWPPNHEMVDVGLVYTVTDNCDADPVLDFVVTSDEPTAGDGAGGKSSIPDAELVLDSNGDVVGALFRAERADGGDGRVYRLRIYATDSCGNTSHNDCLVSVQQDLSTRAVDSGQYYDATEENVYPSF